MRPERPDTRVLVFIDGQNVFKRCKALYDHGRCHPLLLAHRLAAGRRLVGVRYYSGVHDSTVEPRIRGMTDRRHELMRSVGVTVVERTLRYRWEWGFDRTGLPDPYRSRGQSRLWTVHPFQRAREKGIDLAIGLDVMDLALRDRMDVAVIVSADSDLCEAARATHAATAAEIATSASRQHSSASGAGQSCCAITATRTSSAARTTPRASIRSTTPVLSTPSSATSS